MNFYNKLTAHFNSKPQEQFFNKYFAENTSRPRTLVYSVAYSVFVAHFYFK